MVDEETACMSTRERRSSDDVRTTSASAWSAAAGQALRTASFAGGLQAALTDGNGRTTATAAGSADLAARVPVGPATLFEIGSISKGFTCALLLRAREDGLVDLDAPVTTYLPWFGVRSRFAPITVRHLMTHTAGIIMGTDFSGDAAYEVWSLRDTEATAQPGTFFHYSNVGYKALGLVLEAICSCPYPLLLRERLLDPLQMRDTEPAITHDVRRRLAVGYEPYYDDRPPQRAHGQVPATWLETATADGSIASTAGDLSLWLRFLMNGGVAASGERLLSAESVQEMLAPFIASDDELPGSGYGLGMWSAPVDGHRYVGHGGGMVGYHAAICCDLDEGAGAAVLANGLGPWRELAFHMLGVARAERAGAGLPAFAAPSSERPSPGPGEPPPPEWFPFAGHYRCHNPWLPNLRVCWRAGELWVEFPSGDVWAAELPLVPLADGLFRVGADERSPERLAFDTVIGGVAVRAVYSGCALYRTFTP
jgi:CubicO group peptidase (beta-lactamase class C family)